MSITVKTVSNYHRESSTLNDPHASPSPAALPPRRCSTPPPSVPSSAHTPPEFFVGCGGRNNALLTLLGEVGSFREESLSLLDGFVADLECLGNDFAGPGNILGSLPSFFRTTSPLRHLLQRPRRYNRPLPWRHVPGAIAFCCSHHASLEQCSRQGSDAPPRRQTSWQVNRLLVP